MNWTNRLATTLLWNSEISNREQKESVANQVAERVRDGDVIGVGSGSTSFLALQAISRKVQERGWSVTAIPTSHEVAMACSVLGIPTTSLMQLRPDWAFDGADEVDPDHNLIKGRGGAMFAEKLVIKSSAENFILVDPSKHVQALGSKFAVPVEVDPRAVNLVESCLEQLGATEVAMRMAKSKDGPVITEAGNLILDVRFRQIGTEMEREIKSIPGVIESGLFIGYPVQILTS